MAIAIDASTPAIVQNASTAKTTASFTAPADSVLVACVGVAGDATVTMSNSGTGLTWTNRKQRKSTDSGAQSGMVAIFTAVTTTAVARTVTATSSVSSNPGGFKLFVVTGADTSSPFGASGAGSSTSNPITPTVYTSTVAGSRAFGIANDWLAAGSPASSDTGFPYDVAGDTSGIAVHKAANTASASTNVTLNFNGDGGSDAGWNWVAVEIKPVSSFPQTITPSAISSAEAFGTAQLNFTVIGSGIDSGESFGSLVITTPQGQTITPSAIASAEAFGTLTTGLYLRPSGISSGEAWGTARLSAVIGPSGIASREAFGNAALIMEQFISPSGIASAQAFGTPRLQLGYPQTIIPVGIVSEEVVEDLSVRLRSRLVLTNPSIQETPAAWHPLFARYGLHRGITIIQDASGAWSSVRYPAQTEIEAALTTYMGGHRHILTTAEAEELILAGYGPYVTLEDTE